MRRMISSYVGENAEFERQFPSGELEVKQVLFVTSYSLLLPMPSLTVATDIYSYCIATQPVSRKRLTVSTISGHPSREDKSGRGWGACLLHPHSLRYSGPQRRSSHQI